MSYTGTAIIQSKLSASSTSVEEYQEHPYPNSPNVIDINYSQVDLYDTRMSANDVVMLKKLDLSLVSSAETGNLVSAVWKGMY